MGLVVRGNYVWCFFIFVCHINGICRSVGCFEVIIWEWQWKPQVGGGNFNGEGVLGLSLCNTVVLKLYCYWVL